VQVPELARGHDTPARTLVSDELELGLDTTDQVVPLKCSMSVWRTDPLLNWPTAVHELVETHEMFERTSIELAFGVGTTDQVAPSQDSTKVFL
jgi:hypothetical protein